MPVQSGFTENTAEHLIFDAGAFYKNYNPVTGVGTLIGATRGGGEFVAKPTIRPIEIDGVKGRAKGLNVIDAWDVSIKANLIEITPEILRVALSTGEVNTTDPVYDVVTAKNTIEIADYIDNIAWIGRLSGSNNPVVIIIYNALNTEGVTLTTADKAESVLPITFFAHYDASDLDTVPFKIYYPKLSTDTVNPTVVTVPADAATAIATTANIVWTFNEAIQPAAVSPANFFLMKALDGTLVPGSLALNAARTVVTLDPTANMTAATAYIATVTKNVKDLNGNALIDNVITNFTTA
ncbi:Ig-like domain-containing protein [Cohnella lupini]|uniref:Ig-like domain-containing protein n=1 Tax=Cohnella lupini TaxID=1294267 RepID=A0A3D9I0W7_9BACL|nr:Ig-like domain-containing protein [Cohnella lupini]RED54796.1 Ig-like domain-containing protein [Cohnella lupini]